MNNRNYYIMIMLIAITIILNISILIQLPNKIKCSCDIPNNLNVNNIVDQNTTSIYNNINNNNNNNNVSDRTENKFSTTNNKKVIENSNSKNDNNDIVDVKKISDLFNNNKYKYKTEYAGKQLLVNAEIKNLSKASLTNDYYVNLGYNTLCYISNDSELQKFSDLEKNTNIIVEAKLTEDGLFGPVLRNCKLIKAL